MIAMRVTDAGHPASDRPRRMQWLGTAEMASAVANAGGLT
jgi:hypothetical protein